MSWCRCVHMKDNGVTIILVFQHHHIKEEMLSHVNKTECDCKH